MRYEKSCGFVAFKRVGGEVYYLIIKGINGDVGFPKGHVEPGESEVETAVRELKEETGVEVEVVDGFRYAMEYKMPRAVDTVKQVVYFLGECTSDRVACQVSEVSDAWFLNYNEAIKALTFKETRELLIAANRVVIRENDN